MSRSALILPIRPKLCPEFRRERHTHRNGGGIFGLFGTPWALMQFIFSRSSAHCPNRFSAPAGRWLLFVEFRAGADYVLVRWATLPHVRGCSSSG